MNAEAHSTDIPANEAREIARNAANTWTMEDRIFCRELLEEVRHNASQGKYSATSKYLHSYEIAVKISVYLRKELGYNVTIRTRRPAVAFFLDVNWS